MLPFLKKRKKKTDSKDEKSSKASEDSDKKKSKKDSHDEGPVWVTFALLFVSVLFGLVFWVYGWLSRGGVVGVSFQNDSPKETQESSGMVKRDGVIIFEK